MVYHNPYTISISLSLSLSIYIYIYIYIYMLPRRPCHIQGDSVFPIGKLRRRPFPPSPSHFSQADPALCKID